MSAAKQWGKSFMEISNSRRILFWTICAAVAVLTLIYSAASHYLHEPEAPSPPAITITGSEPTSVPKPASGQSQQAAMQPNRDQGESLAVIPLKWRFAGIATTTTAKDGMKWLNSYPQEDMPIFRAFNLSHPYAWSINSADQIAWMAANGFPMPEDVVAAAGMSDEQLRDAADNGGMKAKFLYYDRLSSEAGAELDDFKQQGGEVSDFMASHPAIESELRRMLPIVQSSSSPFVGYLEASRAIWIDDPQGRGQVSAGGLALAYFRGDDRAGNALIALYDNGDISESEASMAYRIASELRDYFPLPSDCGPGMSTPFPRPKYPGQ